MHLANTAKGFFQGFKAAYDKVAHRKSHDPSEAPLFDSGIGDWLLDLTGLALIILVLGTVLKWAYLALFHK
jgi:hypothetical protein